MSSTEYERRAGDDYVTELVHTEAQTAEAYGHIPYRLLSVSVDDGQITNDGTDAETVKVECLSNLDMVSNNRKTVLSYDGDVTLFVDGQQTTKTLTNGSVEFELTTDKPAGSEIEIIADSVIDHPAEADRVSIEVV